MSTIFSRLWEPRPERKPVYVAPNIFAGLIRSLRRQQKLSQRQVDYLIGAWPGFTAEIEAGARIDPRGYVYALARVLDTTPMEIDRAARRAQRATKRGGHRVAAY